MWRAQTVAYQKRVKSVIGQESSHSRENHSLRLALPTLEPSSDKYTQARVFKQRLNINTVNSSGETSLMLAAKYGHKNVVGLLIEKNARLDFRDNSRGRETAIDKAAKNGHEETVMLLLERTPWAKDKSKALINAAVWNQPTVVKIMLDRGIDKEFKDEHGQTALSVASRTGKSRVVEVLLDYGADIETKDTNGHTPLMHAVQMDRIGIIARLLQRHANVETKNKAGQNAISLAIKFQERFNVIQWGALRLLLEHGAILRTTHDENITLLMEAARKGEIGVLRFLLEKKNLSIESRSGPTLKFQGEIEARDYTPLVIAASRGQDAMVEFLLHRNANIEAKDICGDTSLAWAARTGRITVVRILLKNNANMESRNTEGRTPLLLAVQLCYLRPNEMEIVAETLLIHGANTDVKDNDGMTPLLWAVSRGSVALVRSLLEHNARTDLKNQDGRTALEFAEYLGERRVVALLLRHDPQSISELNWTRTPLSEAAEKGHESVVKQYLDEGHDIEAKDYIFAQSPLLWAAENGHEGVVRLLLDHGAQIESTNKYRQTALWLGACNGHNYVVRVLLERNAIADLKDNASRTLLRRIGPLQNAGIECMLEKYRESKNGVIK